MKKPGKIIYCAILGFFIYSAGCHKKAEESSVPTIRILENAVPGGINADIYQWLKEQIPEIEKEMGIKIELVSAGIRDEDFKARVALDLKSGRAADIIGFDQCWVPEFAEAKFLLPLDPFLQNWQDRSQYYDTMLAMGSFKGKTYMIMRQIDVRMLFYHKQILADAGIPLPWQPKNWEEIIAASEKIKAKFPDLIPLQINAGVEMGEATTMQGFLMLLYGAGGELYDQNDGKWVIESDAYLQTVDFYRKIYQEKKLVSPELVTSPKAREKTFELFSKGKIAIYLEGTWFYTSVLKPGEAWGIKDRDSAIGWARMPGSGAEGAPEFVSLSGANGLVISPSSKDPELAWKVIARLNSISGLEKLFQKQAFTPPRKDLAQSPVVSQNKFISETALALLPYTRSRPGLPDYPEISFQLQLLSEQIITAKYPPAVALQQYREAIERIVGEENTIQKK